jgi:hypothetical protein
VYYHSVFDTLGRLVLRERVIVISSITAYLLRLPSDIIRVGYTARETTPKNSRATQFKLLSVVVCIATANDMDPSPTSPPEVELNHQTDKKDDEDKSAPSFANYLVGFPNDYSICTATDAQCRESFPMALEMVAFSSSYWGYCAPWVPALYVEHVMPLSAWITDEFQALPLMNIVFGKLVGDFNQYFVPGAAPSEQTFKSSVNRSR